MRYHVMFSNKGKSCSVYIASSYRNEEGKPRKVIFRKCGNKEQLLLADPQALEKIQAEVDRLNACAQSSSVNERLMANEKIFADLNKQLKEGLSLKGETPVLLCLGLELLSKLWDQLNLNYKLGYIQKTTKAEFDFPEIVRQLALGRILMPCSKAKTCRLLPRNYLGAEQIDLAHYYAALDILNDNKESIIKYLNKRISETIQRNTTVCLYDITTYAFESVEPDELRDFGFSKDKKFNEVQVVMALAADHEGIPINYSLYFGKQGESPTMVPFVEELKQKYGLGKLVVVADRGLNNKKNIDCLVQLGHDYVLASRIRSADEKIKNLALSSEGRVYKDFVDSEGEIIKTWHKEITLDEKVSYAYPKFVSENPESTIVKAIEEKVPYRTTKAGNKRRRSVLKRRLIITYSDKRAIKDKADRQRLIDKAKKLTENPGLYASELKRGGKSLVSAEFDRESLKLNTELIKEQEKFDGIHVIETSLDAPAEEVIKIYRGLWHIESNFRVMKSQLLSRPVFVWTENHIRGHFLCCYLALVITRLLECKLRNQGSALSTDKLIEALNALQTMRIKLDKLPAIYATTGIGEEVRRICAAVGAEVPEEYESAAGFRRKLSLPKETGSYFQKEEKMITTSKEKTE